MVNALEAGHSFEELVLDLEEPYAAKAPKKTSQQVVQAAENLVSEMATLEVKLVVDVERGVTEKVIDKEVAGEVLCEEVVETAMNLEVGNVVCEEAAKESVNEEMAEKDVTQEMEGVSQAGVSDAGYEELARKKEALKAAKRLKAKTNKAARQIAAAACKAEMAAAKKAAKLEKAAKIAANKEVAVKKKKEKKVKKVKKGKSIEASAENGPPTQDLKELAGMHANPVVPPGSQLHATIAMSPPLKANAMAS